MSNEGANDGAKRGAKRGAKPGAKLGVKAVAKAGVKAVAIAGVRALVKAGAKRGMKSTDPRALEAGSAEENAAKPGAAVENAATPEAAKSGVAKTKTSNAVGAKVGEAKTEGGGSAADEAGPGVVDTGSLPRTPPAAPAPRPRPALKVLVVASEVEDLAKTGGLADFAKSLPAALRRAGVDARVATPYYRIIEERKFPRVEVPALAAPMGDGPWGCAIRRLDLEGVPVHLVEHHDFYFRDRLYDDGRREYPDNPKRFALLCRAALELCRATGWKPDVVLANDWQGALAAYYLKSALADDPFFAGVRSALVVHNSAYQGHCAMGFADALGVRHADRVPERFEDHGRLNLLKGGIAFADRVVAVSPTYAAELRTDLGSHGLGAALRAKGGDLVGILNGCDYAAWDPARDPCIAERYSAADLRGKAACKRELQRAFGLPQRTGTPLFGMVSRLAEQKGFRYLLPALESIVAGDAQVAVLGSGDEEFVAGLRAAAARWPDRVAFHHGYDWRLSHVVEAGADFFLMPSLYEPCGLNQIYSMRYGTLPVVRAVGGLADTVAPPDEGAGTGTGFVFRDPTPEGVAGAAAQAVDFYRHRRRFLAQMIQNAMAQDFNWDQCAARYLELFELMARG